MEKKLISPPYTVTRKLPKGDKAYLTYFKSELLYNHKNSTYLFLLKNCYITHYGPVFTNFIFAPILTSQMQEKPQYLIKLYLSCIKKIILNKVTKINRKCIVVHNNYVHNYYHWVLEIFFRLYLVKDYLADHVLVLPKLSFNFQKDMLKLLNLEVNKIIEIDPNNLLKAKEVIIPQYPADYGNYEPKLLKGYAQWILSHINKATKSHTPKNLYITRSKASYRRILNEEKVIARLRTLNYEVISLENLSFQEQVLLFNNARAIVAPHGAGLTNLIFCQPQTKIIELLPIDYIHTCFYTLANVFELDYYYLTGKAIKNNPALKPYQYDMEIEISSLVNLLTFEIPTNQNLL